MNDRAKHTINGEHLGLWQGCDGAFYTPHGHCAVCGKPRGDHSVAGGGSAKPEPALADALRPALRACKSLPKIDGELRIVLTRGYRGTPLDRDNLVGGFKPLRDEIARILGRDDAEHHGITWEYDQAPGAVCKVEIFKLEATQMNDEKKKCPHCHGTGAIKSHSDEDDRQCPYCTGRNWPRHIDEEEGNDK